MEGSLSEPASFDSNLDPRVKVVVVAIMAILALAALVKFAVDYLDLSQGPARPRRNIAVAQADAGAIKSSTPPTSEFPLHSRLLEGGVARNAELTLHVPSAKIIKQYERLFNITVRQIIKE